MSIATATFDTTGPEAGARSEDYLWTLNFGPQHPATHTTLRLVLKLDGERVVDAMPEMGYLHSGFEKIGEHLTFNQYVTVTDRMNYISPMANNVAWHHAVETLLGIQLTPRCTYIRTIIAELARISDHLLSNGAVGLDTGAFTFFLYGFYQREVIYDIFETLCGARFTNSYTRVGGVSQDFTPLVIEKIRAFIRTFPKTLNDMERLLTRNRIFVDRTKGVGVLTKEEAINASATGPVARASGVTRDLRKDEPYLAYADLDFQVCCASAGDCYSRYLVRMQEMRESLKLVAQALENLPAGDVNVSIDQRVAGPTKQQVYSSIEGTISHFELSMANRGFEVPHEESYAAIEAPNGELGFYVVGDGSENAYRARCRPPSVLHFALFPQLIRGHTLSDVVAVLGSLNIIAAELDRGSKMGTGAMSRLPQATRPWPAQPAMVLRRNRSRPHFFTSLTRWWRRSRRSRRDTRIAAPSRCRRSTSSTLNFATCLSVRWSRSRRFSASPRPRCRTLSPSTSSSTRRSRTARCGPSSAARFPVPCGAATTCSSTSASRTAWSPMARRPTAS